MKNSESVLQSIDDNFGVNDPENKVLQFIHQQYPEINLEDFTSILKLITQHYQQILEDKEQELEKCQDEISFLKRRIEQIEARYKMQLEAKDESFIIAQKNYDQEIIFLRKMVEELAKRPEYINIVVDTNNQKNSP